MKVLVIPASYFSRNRTVGGGERYALEYARAMASLMPTTLALFDLSPTQETRGALEIRTFKVRHFRQRLCFPLSRDTWHALREYELLHLMVFPTPLTDLLVTVARWRRQLVVLTDVGGGGPCWSSYLQKLHPQLNLNRLAHGLAPLSRHAAQRFCDWPQPKTILYGGVNLEAFRTDDAAPAGYALFVGRLLPHKGVLPLIEALEADTPLRVVGRPYDPAYLAQLQRAAAGKNVRFILDADDVELSRQYAGANVVLQPSLPAADPAHDSSELLGLVTLEAMGCGKPVIVTRTASLPELVVDGETGFVVDPRDQAALRRHVEGFLRDPGLSRRMGAAARRHVEQHFTWDQVARRGMEFYQRLRSLPK
jgi:glycosyltransferase involved in cell wall biosynthesis